MFYRRYVTYLKIQKVVDKQKFHANYIKEIIQWNSQLEPSVNMTQSIIASYLLPNEKKQEQEENESKNNLQQQTLTSQKSNFIKNFRQNNQENNQNYHRLFKAVEDVPKLIRILQQNKCPKNFIRAYLLLIKKNMKKIKHIINSQYILKQWAYISPELLQTYCDTFSIKIQKYSQMIKGKQDKKIEKIDKQQNGLQKEQICGIIKAQQFDKKIYALIEKKDYTNCMTLIKFSNCQKDHVNVHFLPQLKKLLSKMTNNKQASKAADYIKSLKLNPVDYPALGQRLYKNTARHFLTKNGWEYAEEIFQTHPQALACVVEDLIFKKKFNQALSIWHRNQSCRQHIIKEDALLYLKKYVDQKGNPIKIQEIRLNFLHNDQFGPSNRQKYFSLQDFGYRQQQIVWIDENCKQVKEYMQQLLDSQLLGIDTQSIVGQTKFEKSQSSKFQEAALIQIATPKRIFLIDGFTVKNIPQVKSAITEYIKRRGLIIGHTLDNDMECLLKSLGFSDEQIKTINTPRVIDVWKLFKAVHPQLKFSSLTFISQKMLGKQICKDQTLTNWKRRPLRKNQIHYAAMDAVVVIEIYKKFIDEIGEQMIQYYCSVQGDF